MSGHTLPRDGFLVVQKRGADMTFTTETYPIRFGRTRDEEYEHAVLVERYRAERAAHQVALANLWEEINRRSYTGVLDAVLALHRPVFRDYHLEAICEGCDSDGMESESPEWPCRTIEVIAAASGVEVPL